MPAYSNHFQFRLSETNPITVFQKFPYGRRRRNPRNSEHSGILHSVLNQKIIFIRGLSTQPIRIFYKIIPEDMIDMQMSIQQSHGFQLLLRQKILQSSFFLTAKTSAIDDHGFPRPVI